MLYLIAVFLRKLNFSVSRSFRYCAFKGYSYMLLFGSKTGQEIGTLLISLILRLIKVLGKNSRVKGGTLLGFPIGGGCFFFPGHQTRNNQTETKLITTLLGQSFKYIAS